jgi:hypothetical protein
MQKMQITKMVAFIIQILNFQFCFILKFDRLYSVVCIIQAPRMTSARCTLTET